MSLKVPDTFNRVLIFPSMHPHLRLEHPHPPRRVPDAGFLNLFNKDRLNQTQLKNPLFRPDDPRKDITPR